MVKLINGDGLILGRVASYVAKHAMQGEQIRIINAEKMVISGDKNKIVEKYIKRRRLKNKANPEHSPHWPKRPDYFVKRVIKGMLPTEKKSGRVALKNIRVYIGENGNVKGEVVEFGDNYKKDKLLKYATVYDVCKALSYKY